MRRLLLLALAVIAVVGYPAVTSAGPNGSGNGTNCSLMAQLDGANEVPPRATAAFGHTEIKIRNDATLEFRTHIVNDGATFTAGHVHSAPVGVNGPVVVPLFSGSVSDDQIKAGGEIAIDAALAEAICASPDQYYVNYHTTQFPGGVIRGQLG
jgi:hypothetical protein